MEQFWQLEPTLIQRAGATAAIVYAALKSRFNLSLQAKNMRIFRDSRGVFCNFSRQELCKLIGKSKPTITKAMQKLKELGLIVEKRLGLGHVNRIYLTQLQPNAQQQAEVKQSNTASKTAKPAEAKQDAHGYNRPYKIDNTSYTRSNAPKKRWGYITHNYTDEELNELNERCITDIMGGAGDD